MEDERRRRGGRHGQLPHLHRDWRADRRRGAVRHARLVRERHPGEAFFHITTDAYSHTCVKFRAKRDPYEGVEPAIAIYAVLDLSDCVGDDPAEWRNLVPMRYDVMSDTYAPADGSHPPQMFFKWRVNVLRTEE